MLLPTTPFAPRHTWDRTFSVMMLGAVWVAILSGFLYRNVKSFAAGQLSYPWIVHVHGVVFVAWLVLLSAQIAFVRRGDVVAHRRLGRWGAWLAGAMVVLGVATAVMTERLKFGTPAADTRFLSVMFADMLIFGGLVTAAMRLRRDPAAHKRLMLVATLGLTDAGFGRWLSPLVGEWMGQKNFWDLATFQEGAWPFIRFQLLPAYTLIALVGIYDAVTRKRLHPAYLWAVAICLPVQLAAGWLYFQPFWQALAVRIIGRG